LLAIFRDYPRACDQFTRPFGERVRERGDLAVMRCLQPSPPAPLPAGEGSGIWDGLSAAIPIKQQQLYATNQPRGRGVGAVPGLAGYGTPWASGFTATVTRKPALPRAAHFNYL